MSRSMTPVCAALALGLLSSTVLAQGLSMAEFEARRRELRERYIAATTPAEKAAIVAELEALGLAAPEAEQDRPARITATRLNIRNGAGTNHGVDFQLEKGDEVRIVGRQGDWVVVEHEENGQVRTGWAHSKFVEPVDPDAPAPDEPGPQDLVDAANRLVDDYADFYGVQDPWKNLDPNHALPANVRLGGLKGRWKCNLFGGNALYLAGFDPPYYGNRGKGEYPNANQWYKFSDKYASRYGNKVHFEMVAELDVQSLSGEARRQAIADLLARAEPGDFIMVDHLGDGVSDGGHTRLVTANDGSGTVSSAMASYDSALVRAEGVDAYMNEETIWVLRPNRPRP